jgi:AraC-like DNA-binding protein
VECVNRAIDYIVDRLSEPLRLGDVARAARLSPFHFHRVFQALSGETPGDFVKRLRLEKAVGMMAHARPASLTSIAFACGFASSADFSRCFKQRFGVPPSLFDIDAWREAHADALAATIPSEVERRPQRSLPPWHIAEVEIRGDISLELRALQWLYGSWLPRSRYVPDDQPCFEAWIGRPFAHGFETFALRAQLPIRRLSARGRPGR